MTTPKEIVDGLFHWTGIHPGIGIRVSSYYLVPERVLMDPVLPSPSANRIAWLRKHGPPEHILLTNRLHSRHSAKLVAAFGCTVWCNRAGLYHLASSLKARPFDAGDQLPGRVRAVEIGVICPDESALLLPRVRAAAVADGVIRRGNGPLSFVPDDLLVDDPRDAERVKQELRAAYRRLAKHRFEHLLMAHGNPWLHDGRAALRAWAGP
jgi:hypothetical protein